MNSDRKFNQIWEFRRRDDDVDSSDDSKSNSDVGPAQKKHKLVPSLFLPETDDVSENGDEQHVQHEKKAKRIRNGPKKERTKREVKSKPRKVTSPSSMKKGEGNSGRKKRSKFISQMTVSDDFRIFTESILHDLRVARENMFAKMKKEMDQLLTSKPPSRSATRRKGSSCAKNPNQKRSSRKTSQAQRKQEAQLAVSKALNCNVDGAQEQQENNNEKEKQRQEMIQSSAKSPVFVECSAKKTILTSSQDQIVSSSSVPCSYLTLPSVLPNSKATDTSLNVERDSLINTSHFSGLQGEELFRSFGHGGTESSCIGNGYPVALNHHHRLDNINSFGIPNQVVQESSLGTVLGLRMHGGGIRYSTGLGMGSGNHTLPSHFVPNNFRSLYRN